MSGSNQVKVICGPGNDVFDLDGISVRGAQRSLVDAFNVPADAPALVNGHLVDPDHRLRAGDIVEFLPGQGWKGLGALFTPEDLIARWHITAVEYDGLLDLGLPTIRLRSGSVRHPEIAVDEWLKQLQPARQQDAGDRLPDWCHGAGAEPPPSFAFGPLEGTQKELASWTHQHGNQDARSLQARAERGAVWVKMHHKRRYEVWFRNKRQFENAKQRRDGSSRADDELK
jgi:hypothetical protein